MTITAQGDTVSYGNGGSVGQTAQLAVPAGAFVTSVTLVTDTNAYADNDVLVVPQEVTGVFPSAGAPLKLRSLILLDEADQGQDIDLIFFNAAATLGTINSAVSINDTDAAKVIGHVSILQADYTDLVNSMFATKGALDRIMVGATTSLWIAAICRSGTPTYAASSLKLKLAWERC